MAARRRFKHYLFIYLCLGPQLSVVFVLLQFWRAAQLFPSSRFIHELCWRRKACNNCNADNFLSEISFSNDLYLSAQTIESLLSRFIGTNTFFYLL